MGGVTLRPVPISTERFAPYGDVIHAAPAAVQAMNDARFERFDDLAKVDVDQADGGRVAISIARSKTPTTLPHRFDMVERHPLGHSISAVLICRRRCTRRRVRGHS